MGNNEMMLGVDGTLNIVPNHPATSATCGHRASIGVSQGYLLVLGLHHQSVQTVEALYLLAQCRNLLVEPGDFGLRYCIPLTIGAVELREIAGDALVNRIHPLRTAGNWLFGVQWGWNSPSDFRVSIASARVRPRYRQNHSPVWRCHWRLKRSRLVQSRRAKGASNSSPRFSGKPER